MRYQTKLYTFTIGANQTFKLNVGGGYFKITAATGGVDVKCPDAGISLSGMLPGYGLQKTPFSYLDFIDTSGAPNTISVVISDENFVDTRITGSVTFAPLQATFGNSNKTVTNASAQLLAANASRKYLLIQNNGTGDIYVTVDGTAATTANGVRIAAGGGSYELSTVVPTGQINAIGSIANNPNITVVEG
jgi:hypothetical protein